MTWRQPRPKRGAPWPLSPHGVKHALLSLGSGPVAASVRTALAVTCHRYRTGGSSSHTGQFLQLSWFWHMPSTPPPIVGVYEYGKKCGNGWHSTTAVREQRADLLATQVTLHRALLCIEQPLSSTVSLHHPARPHSPLCLTRLNAPWMAAECRNLRAVCKNGNFLLMVAHLAPKHFSQGEALGCILQNWNRYNEGHWRQTQLNQSMSDGDPSQEFHHCGLKTTHASKSDIPWFCHISEAILSTFYLQRLICLPFVPSHPLTIKQDGI